LLLSILLPVTCDSGSCRVKYVADAKDIVTNDKQKQNDNAYPDIWRPANGPSLYKPPYTPSPSTPPQIIRPTPTPEPTPVPVPPVNNTPSNGTLHVRIAVGGSPSSFNAKTLEWYKSQGVNEIHVVVPDLNPYPELAALIRAYGMVPVYNLEHPLWVDSGSQDLNFNYYRPQLFSISQSHWAAFSSEGLRSFQVSVLDEYLPFVSYFGDQGDNLYALPYYSHPYNSHYANYPEFYYSWYYGSYINTMIEASKVTPQHAGMTLGLWSTADLSRDPSSVEGALRILNNNHVNLNGFTFLFWGGTYDPMLWLRKDPYGYGGDFVPTLQFVQSLNGRQYTAPMVAS